MSLAAGQRTTLQLDPNKAQPLSRLVNSFSKEKEMSACFLRGNEVHVLHKFRSITVSVLHLHIDTASFLTPLHILIRESCWRRHVPSPFMQKGWNKINFGDSNERTNYWKRLHTSTPQHQNPQGTTLKGKSKWCRLYIFTFNAILSIAR